MPDFSEAGNAAGGSLTITRNGDEYTITVNFIDDAETPHRITGTCLDWHSDSLFIHGIRKWFVRAIDETS